MLVGKELLEKSKLLCKKSEDEIAKGCGYVGPSGRVLRKSFYKALIEAKGYKLGKNGTKKSGSRTSKLGLEPGQEFKIDIKKESKTINLIPLN